MAKSSNPNTKNNSDAYPGRVSGDSIRNKIDPETGAREQHERDLARLDNSQPREKGGRG